MANFRMEALTRELRNKEENGITFEDKMLKWDSADDVKEVVEALKNTKVVNFLKLDGNTLGVDAAKAIGDALKSHPEMKKALWKNLFTSRSKFEIPEALKHLSRGLMLASAQLTVLDLSDNALGPNGMVGLTDLLTSPVCYSLQELILNNCGLGIQGGEMLSNSLVSCHAASVAAGKPLRLKVFIAGRNRLENDGAKFISKIFYTIKTLEMIALPQNSIYAAGMAALATGIKENTELKVLNLNDNTMGVKGATAIADAMASTPKLREINFGDCLIRTDGAYNLAAILDDIHHDIEVVDLGFNEIRSDGGVALANIFSKKNHLKRLNLNGNQFGNLGRSLVTEIMQTAINPESLDSLDEDQEEEGEELEGEEEEGEENDEVGTNSIETVENSADTGVENDDEEWEDEGETETVDEVDDDEEEEEDDEEGVEEVEVETGMGTRWDNQHEVYEREYDTCSDEEAYHLLAHDTTKEVEDQHYTLSPDIVPIHTAAELFCLHRTACPMEMFTNITGNKLATIRDVFKFLTNDDLTLIMIFAALKCAHLSSKSVEALNCAKELFKEIFEHARKTKQEARILNHILIHVGLLRTDLPFQACFNAKNCQFVLRETIREEKISSDNIRSTLRAFFDETPIICNGAAK